MTVLETLSAALSDGAQAVRGAALTILERMDTDEARRALLEGLKRATSMGNYREGDVFGETTVDGRLWALEELIRLCGEEAIPVVRERLVNGSLREKMAAMKWVGEAKDVEAISTLRDIILEEAIFNRGLKEEAIVTLVDVAGGEAVNFLAELLHGEGVADMRDVLLKELGRLGAYEAVKESLDSDDPEEVLLVMEALSESGNIACLERICALVRNDNALVRIAAVEAIDKLTAPR